MPTKTERILSYLPQAFRAGPRPSALYALADAFGGELQQAENALGALMLAHWTDRADQGGDAIADLAALAALYGLAPRNATPIPVPAGTPAPPYAADETIEEFRAHLKRYVRTFVDGTPTVQGVLRVVAEALGMRIADDYAQLDAWWARASDALTTSEPSSESAAEAVFGMRALRANGAPAAAAGARGSVDLRAGADLAPAAALLLAVDGGAPLAIDLSAHASDPPADMAGNVARAIAAALPGATAQVDDGRLVLASRTVGAASRLDVLDAAGDAAPALLGLAPRRYAGTAQTTAAIVGTADLSGGIDTSADGPRYLRLLIDGTRTTEVDLAAGAPGPTSIAQIVEAINDQTALALASHDGRHLVLSAPTAGSAGSVAALPATAQDARARLLGSAPSFAAGSDPRSARVAGTRDLSAGVDLSARSRLLIALDGASAVEVDCRGADPRATQPGEIVAAINAALGAPLASQDGSAIVLRSPSAGPGGSVAFPPAGAADALEPVFGIAPRTFAGAAAAPATIVGTPDLSAGVEVGGRRLLRIALDGAAPRTVDLRSAAPFDRAALTRTATAAAVRDAINAVFGAPLAAERGGRIVLTAPSAGGASSIALLELETTSTRRFVTRAFFADDAAATVLGTTHAVASGSAATAARIAGGADLGRGVDLSRARALRITVDAHDPVDVDCAAASSRPRAALAGEVASAINAALAARLGAALGGVASSDGHRLVLTSPTAGAASRVALSPGGSALERLGLAPGSLRGSEATTVTFRATADLSGGVDLGAADRLNLSIDGTAREVACAGPDAAHTTLSQIVVRINLAFGSNVAAGDGRFVVLRSALRGAAGAIAIAAPSTSDATRAILGVTSGREYRGTDAQPARAVGAVDLVGPQDLRATRFISLAVDGSPPRDIDCAGPLPEATQPGQIVAAIEAVFSGLAALDGARLVLVSGRRGTGARIEIAASSAGDARALVLGSTADAAAGSAPAPATIEGTVDLLAPLDLGAQSELLLAVDGGAGITVDLAGKLPGATTLAEIVGRLDAAVPGVASATADDRLRLTSPTSGPTSRLEIRPLRALELIDFPPQWREQTAALVRGASWTVHNDGAAAAAAELTLDAPQGLGGAELVNLAAGLRLRLQAGIGAGERVRIARDARYGLRAELTRADGSRLALAPAALAAGPIGAAAGVPFAPGARHALAVDDLARGAALTLDNPLGARVVRLRALRPRAAAGPLVVQVAEAALGELAALPASAADGTPLLRGRLVARDGGHALLDGAGATLALLRGSWPDVVLDQHLGRVVAVGGTLVANPAGPPSLLVRTIAALFDVTLEATPPDGPPVSEAYPAVTVGEDDRSSPSLRGRVLAASALVGAEELDKGAVLALPRGRSSWLYLDCDDARFDAARFERAAFPGRSCRELGIFDAALFAAAPEQPLPAFGPAPAGAAPIAVRLRWQRHAPGAFTVNLPADLPEEFGARFDAGRFATAAGAPEVYDDAVVDPEHDPAGLIARINAGSALVVAQRVERVPLGYEAQVMPFGRLRRRHLTLGAADAPARMYLSDPGAPYLVELSAARAGAAAAGDWGNGIVVSARNAGPARFDLTVDYDGGRFESGRITALAGGPIAPGRDPLPALTAAIVKPGPVGVLQAKAAGIRADVTRDRTPGPGAAD